MNVEKAGNTEQLLHHHHHADDGIVQILNALLAASDVNGIAPAGTVMNEP